MAEVALCLLVAWIVIGAFGKKGKGQLFGGYLWPVKRKRK